MAALDKLSNEREMTAHMGVFLSSPENCAEIITHCDLEQSVKFDNFLRTLELSRMESEFYPLLQNYLAAEHFYFLLNPRLNNRSYDKYPAIEMSLEGLLISLGTVDLHMRRLYMLIADSNMSSDLELSRVLFRFADTIRSFNSYSSQAKKEIKQEKEEPMLMDGDVNTRSRSSTGEVFLALGYSAAPADQALSAFELPVQIKQENNEEPEGSPMPQSDFVIARSEERANPPGFGLEQRLPPVDSQQVDLSAISKDISERHGFRRGK